MENSPSSLGTITDAPNLIKLSAPIKRPQPVTLLLRVTKRWRLARTKISVRKLSIGSCAWPKSGPERAYTLS